MNTEQNANTATASPLQSDLDNHNHLQPAIAQPSFGDATRPTDNAQQQRHNQNVPESKSAVEMIIDELRRGGRGRRSASVIVDMPVLNR